MYKKFINAKKETIIKIMGTGFGTGFGTTVGIKTIPIIIIKTGAVPGLGGTGIATALASVGAKVGGGMVAGVMVLSGLPLVGAVVGGVAGYYITKKSMKSKTLISLKDKLCLKLVHA